ncbi:hypothetical protein COU56_03515 [Candidatus Pacearchaeota archaeon CG10_big_fil_rev_8_21_14_0_10_31_9]|nr:MAG: hypothetical protein AUJ62_02195 [Candidatus Pacearchaeota archaeon CG1_02_32_21]PIN93601.1 MAG: hypothetical protein COU56_03515 [Candidatus Pacearchaeota archaeon CG10_big_fil_rev_8_21_14_0_10_31_9]PIZ82683.1 MAG: hypothetical protein COX97_03545 [Candidatus Pacearchaeota archaeon CG_4_10_14_0_2_um_filter_05_32_18]
MISERKVKHFVAKKSGKKISKEAVKKINELVTQYMVNLLNGASRNADFNGRVVIRKEDFK